MLLFWPYIPGNIYCGGSSSRVHHLNGQLVVHGLTRAQVAYTIHCPTNDLYHEVLQSKVRLGFYDKDIFAMEVRKGNTSAWYFCVFSFFLIYIPD